MSDDQAEMRAGILGVLGNALVVSFHGLLGQCPDCGENLMPMAHDLFCWKCENVRQADGTVIFADGKPTEAWNAEKRARREAVRPRLEAMGLA
jgi:hypothetical protein